MGEGPEIPQEALDGGDFHVHQAVAQVAEDSGEGGQGETGLDDFWHEGVGVGEGFLFDLSAGPLAAQGVGLAFQVDLDEGARVISRSKE